MLYRCEEEDDFSTDSLRSIARELVPLQHFEPARILTPIKLAYDLHWLDG